MNRSRITDATTRLQLRRRLSRRRRLIQFAVALAAAVVVGVLVWLVAFSPVLAAREVRVSGNRVLQRQDVLASAGVTLGTPLLWIDPGRVADRVAGLPPVEAVTVARAWPNRVTIQITERTARLAVSYGTGYLLADAMGVVFEAVTHAPSGLVRVQADPDDQRALVDVGTVYSALSPTTAAQVSSIQAPSRDSIVIRLRDGSRIMWGSAEDSAAKSGVVDGLLPHGGSVFDVSAPSHPTIRP